MHWNFRVFNYINIGAALYAIAAYFLWLLMESKSLPNLYWLMLAILLASSFFSGLCGLLWMSPLSTSDKDSSTGLPQIVWILLWFLLPIFAMNIVGILIALPTWRATPNAAAPQADLQYGAVLNAGSNGSRLAIFKWRVPDSGIPEVWQIASVKDKDLYSEPECPLTHFTDHPNNKTCECLVALTERARDKAYPSLDRPNFLSIPLWVMATAGVRGQDDKNKKIILEATNQCLDGIKGKGYQLNYPRIISGPEEGLYAWLAVNYSAKTLQTEVVDDTHGIVELGGLSAQLAYRVSEPLPPIRRGKIDEIFTVNFGHSNLHVYSASYSLGKDVAIKELRTDDLCNQDNLDIIKNCVDDKITPFLNTKIFAGRSSYHHLTNWNLPTKMNFNGLANFDRFVANMGLGHDSTLKDLRRIAEDICGGDKDGTTRKSETRKSTFEDAKVHGDFRGNVCFDAFYATELAKYGWGIELEKISRSNIDNWPLGAMIFEAAKTTN